MPETPHATARPAGRLLSLAHFTVIQADPVALVHAAAAGGFDAVGLRVMPPLPGDSIMPVVGDLPLQRRIAQALRETGLAMLDIEAFWLMPETDIEAWLPALDVAVTLGARHVLTVGHDPDSGRLATNFARFAEAAAERGLRIMLEFIPYSRIRSLGEAAALLRQVGPRDAGLLVDALHLSRSGGHPADLAALDPALFSYGHLCDVPAAAPPPDQLRAEARGARVDPGEGGLWLDDFVAAFPAGTPMAVEAPNAAFAAMPPAERAQRAGTATRRLLARHA